MYKLYQYMSCDNICVHRWETSCPMIYIFCHYWEIMIRIQIKIAKILFICTKCFQIFLIVAFPCHDYHTVSENSPRITRWRQGCISQGFWKRALIYIGSVTYQRALYKDIVKVILLFLSISPSLCSVNPQM